MNIYKTKKTLCTVHILCTSLSVNMYTYIHVCMYYYGSLYACVYVYMYACMYSMYLCICTVCMYVQYVCMCSMCLCMHVLSATSIRTHLRFASRRFQLVTLIRIQVYDNLLFLPLFTFPSHKAIYLH